MQDRGMEGETKRKGGDTVQGEKIEKERDV